MRHGHLERRVRPIQVVAGGCNFIFAQGGAVRGLAALLVGGTVADHRPRADQGGLVRLGARSGNLYEVLDGLAEGERVIVRGQHGLEDGQKVEVVAAAPTAQK